MTKNKNTIVFLTNGTEDRVYYCAESVSTKMFDTSDDRNIERIWQWETISDRNEIIETRIIIDQLTSKSDITSKWRLMDHTGVDKGLIRNIIAALNYNKYCNALTEDCRNAIETIISSSRNIWQYNQDEPVPDPIPLAII